MHDVARTGIIVDTVVATTLFRIRSINGLRLELNSFQSDVIGKLDAIQQDMRLMDPARRRRRARITNPEQTKS